jgi:hypothetical protein
MGTATVADIDKGPLVGGTGSVVGVACVVGVVLLPDVVDVVPLALGWFVDEQAARRAPPVRKSRAPVRIRRADEALGRLVPSRRRRDRAPPRCAALCINSVSRLSAVNGRSAGAPAHFRFRVAYRAVTNFPMRV